MAGTLADTAVCNPDPCTASDVASENGADGTFYCVNGGTIGGTTGSCTCTDCDAGYGGANCQTIGACTASTDATKDGSDGTFYCINGGTVGGITGACICASCSAGYEGTSCQKLVTRSSFRTVWPKQELAAAQPSNTGFVVRVDQSMFVVTRESYSCTLGNSDPKG